MSPERIIVGVDVGLTYTGVAFSTTDCSTPHIINRWPGIDEIRNKVPTAVGYRAGTRNFTSWGFGCPPPGKLGRGEVVKDCFKLFLDPKHLEGTFTDNGGHPVEGYDVKYDDVQHWYQDFLTGLYKHIGERISAFFTLADWKEHTIDFFFSVPTTWEGPIVNKFEDIIKAAGFGMDSEEHSVEIQLTEAEAAAVYAVANPHDHKAISVSNGDSGSVDEYSPRSSDVKEGDVILVCDSGGGTTDVSVVKVVSLKDVDEHDQYETTKLAELKQLDKVNGDAIGSTQIDDAFREKVDKRLKDISRQSNGFKLPECATDEIVKGEFQIIKEEVGGKPELPKFLLKVPGLPSDFSSRESMIESSHMVFTRVVETSNEILEIFDNQIRGICNVIDRQLRRMMENSLEKVSHFVLSGGLCSSKYVQSQLLRRYGLAEHGVKILIDKIPQLVVCKGLVIDRLHRLKYNAFILPSLCCRGSYGILYNEPLDSKKLSGHQKIIRTDPNNGKKYAVGQIRWFIRQGEPIKRDEPIFYPFCRIINGGNQKMVWRDTIASSNSPANRLPSNIYEGDAIIVSRIESKLSLDALEKVDGAKKKQKRLFGFKIGKDFWKIDHMVCVHISSANLRFEVQFGGNVIGSRTVPVVWTLEPPLGQETQDDSESTMEGEDNNWYHSLTI